MLWPLAFKAVWQQQHQSVLLTPFVFSSNQILVDNYLRTVDEVAELCFPHHKCFLIRVRVAIFKAHRRIFA